MPLPNSNAIGRVAVLGNHSPRKCGIATFTEHLSDSIASLDNKLVVDVVAMSDRRGYRYPRSVRYQIPENDENAYIDAAKFLNIGNYDVLSVQHEYGIYGGESGALLLSLLREVKMPIVTTLHTVLESPSDSQRRVMDELIQLSEGVVVMTKKGAHLLESAHDFPAAKVRIIPHGVPEMPGISCESTKRNLGIEDRPMIMTFGLLSPDKGIELMIEALAKIVEEVPNAVYVVVGATHPQIRKHSGEEYRKSLMKLCRDLGLRKNVLFVDKFLEEEELVRLICAADVYVTPYQKEQQITSGTLAYAVGLGKAVISTPYWHASELLAGGRGVLVPFKGTDEIARAAIDILTNPEQRSLLEAKASEVTQETVWPSVARAYLDEFWTARKASANNLKAVVHSVGRSKMDAPSFQPSLDHLFAMTDDTGLLQHARFTTPFRGHGYCVDDNARGLLLTCLLGTKPGSRLDQCQSTYLAFILDALNESNGRFRNFMAFDRTWLEEAGSEDSHGRTVWSLGVAVSMMTNESRRQLCVQLFQDSAACMQEFTSPRAWAYGILGACKYLEKFPGDRLAETLRDTLATKVYDLFSHTADADWRWFENSLAYCNARLPQALLEAGTQADNKEWVAAGFETLEWLTDIQTNGHGYFAPIGTNGFYVKGERRAIYDQQPVEAWATASACITAYRVSGDEKWRHLARQAQMWFVGENSISESLVVDDMGTCCDGLHLDRANQNCGAESTLSYLATCAEMQLELQKRNHAEGQVSNS